MSSIFENIDEFYKASDIINMIVAMQTRAEERLKDNLRSDGHAKRGKALGVQGLSFHADAAKVVLKSLAEEIDNW